MIYKGDFKMSIFYRKVMVVRDSDGTLYQNGTLNVVTSSGDTDYEINGDAVEVELEDSGEVIMYYRGGKFRYSGYELFQNRGNGKIVLRY